MIRSEFTPRPLFPFTALLGQEALQTALLVNAVDPLIGGVLVRGHKGTGKSTAARALAGLLPSLTVVADCPCHCDPDRPDDLHDDCRQRQTAGETLPREELPTPFVDLPLSATEDRLVGTLELERTLATGRRHFQPGLLATANRGILYVDEVNLLPDHLVDLLLDVAASGINTVEREGLHYSHPARFLLIGTMNPEEGELRPQFLDRFGLCVAVSGLTSAELRREIVLRRLAFDHHPQAFCARFQASETALASQLRLARQRLDQVDIPLALIDRAVALAAAAKAQGHRAELALVRAARALAALCDREAATPADLVEAARLVLPHRVDGGAANPERSAAQLEELLGAGPAGAMRSAAAPATDDEPVVLLDNMDFPGSAAAGSMLFTYLKKKSAERTFTALDGDALTTTAPPLQRRRGRPHPGAGRAPQADRGRRTGSTPRRRGERLRAIDLAATLAATVRRQQAAGTGILPLRPAAADWYRQRFEQRPHRLVLFVVDTSDSMGDGPELRMAAALGTAIALARRAYLNRDQVALVTFRDRAATLAVPPTGSVQRLRDRLHRVTVGGATPLADGLRLAHDVLRQARLKDPGLTALLILISDGEATVPLRRGGDPAADALAMAGELRRDGVASMLIDTGAALAQERLLPRLAEALGGHCRRLQELTTGELLQLLAAAESGR